MALGKRGMGKVDEEMGNKDGSKAFFRISPRRAKGGN
jgi:hypothetical protein